MTSGSSASSGLRSNSWEARPLTAGGTAPGTAAGGHLLQLLGGPTKMVYGYGGSAEAAAAFDPHGRRPGAQRFPLPNDCPTRRLPRCFRYGADPARIPNGSTVTNLLGSPGSSAIETNQRDALTETVNDVLSRVQLPPQKCRDIVAQWRTTFRTTHGPGAGAELQQYGSPESALAAGRRAIEEPDLRAAAPARRLRPGGTERTGKGTRRFQACPLRPRRKRVSCEGCWHEQSQLEDRCRAV